MVSITRVSPFTGKQITKEINVTLEQLAKWESGIPIQKVMPDVSPQDREFIMTGITKEEWESELGVEKD